MEYNCKYDIKLKRDITVLEKVDQCDIEDSVFKVDESVDEIGEEAFNNIDVTEVILPNGIVRIRKRAFNSSKLRLINFPEGLEEIEEFAFTLSDIGKNKETIILPKSLKKIGTKAFAYTKISSIIFEGIPYIGNQAFRNSNIEILEIPEKLIYIGECAFKNNNIRSLKAPYDVVENSIKDKYRSPFCDNPNIESGYYNDCKHFEEKIPKRKLKKITKVQMVHW